MSAKTKKKSRGDAFINIFIESMTLVMAWVLRVLLVIKRKAVIRLKCTTESVSIKAKRAIVHFLERHSLPQVNRLSVSVVKWQFTKWILLPKRVVLCNDPCTLARWAIPHWLNDFLSGSIKEPQSLRDSALENSHEKYFLLFLTAKLVTFLFVILWLLNWIFMCFSSTNSTNMWKTFIECRLYTMRYTVRLRYSSEQNCKSSCPHGTYIIV